MSHKDPMGYYEILGVSPSASVQEIKIAYRRKAQELHPDKNKSTNTTEKFQLLNEAYQVLKDPASRARYDTSTIKAKPENNKSNQKNSDSRSSQNIQPIFCSCCGKITAQPRYAIFYEINSFVFFTRKKPIQGIFCSACAGKTSLKSTLKTLIFGWWGLPWGLLYPPFAIITNLLGGVKPAAANAQIAAHQAWAIAMQGNIDLARAIALNAIRYAKKIKTSTLDEYRQKLGYTVENQREIIIASMENLLANTGGKQSVKRLKNPWSIISKPYLIQWLIVSSFLIGIVNLLSLNKNNNGHKINQYTYGKPSNIGVPTSTTKPVASSVTTVGSYASGINSTNQNSPNQQIPIEVQPAPGAGNVLTMEELHYCLAEKIRLNGARSVVNDYSKTDIDRFNSMISDYNSRCGSYRYRVGTLEIAQHDVDSYFNQYLADGRNGFIKLKTASEPLSSSSVLQQVLMKFNSRDGTGHLILSDLPNDPRFQNIKEWVGRYMDVQLLVKQNFPADPTHSIYLLSAVPDLKEKFECHACAPLIYALLTHTDPSGQEKIDGSLQPLGQFGSFGKYSLSKNEKPIWNKKIGPDLFGDLKFLRLSKENEGFSLSDGYMAQGERTGYIAIFRLQNFDIFHLADVSILDDARGGFCSENPGAPCANYHATIYIIPNKSSTLYPIKVVESGLKWSKDYKKVVPAGGVYWLTFNGKNYVRKRN